MLKSWSYQFVFVAAVVGMSLVQASRAAVIATYTFPGADPAGDAAVPTVAHADLTPFTRTGLTAVSLNDQFASTDYTSSTTIVTNSDYAEFTITADPGYRLVLQSITFSYTRTDQNSNRTGPQNGAVQASFEGFAAGSGTGSTFSPVTTEKTSTWDFTDYTSGSGGSATFRFYGWNSAGNPSSSMRLILDDITLNGAVIHAPEPASVMGVSAVAAFLASRRRMRKPEISRGF